VFQGKEKTIIRAIALFSLAMILSTKGLNIWVIAVVCFSLWFFSKAIEIIFFQEVEEGGNSSNELS